MSAGMFLVVFLTPVLLVILYLGYGGKIPFLEK